MNRRQFLINCDDLGMHPSINEGIANILKANIISSCSLMAVGLYSDDAVARLKDIGVSSVGVHLTVNAEYPALPVRPLTDQASSLTDGRGVFLNSPGQTRDALVLDEMIAELEAQINLVTDHGFDISHFDGHMFFYEPDIGGEVTFQAVHRLAEQYGVPLRVVNGTVLRGPVKQTHFIWEEYETIARRHNFYKTTLLNPANTCDEIIIHPGSNIDSLSQITSSGILRYADYTFFSGCDFADICRTNNLDIISWNNI
ncbi:carbohydrate deacetylase [Planctomycetota bacterium]